MADEFNPDATDGDGDGMVQDGTEFERPVEEAAVLPEEVVEAVLETAELSEAPAPEADVISAPATNTESKPALSPTKDGAIGSSAADAKPKKKAAPRKQVNKTSDGTVAVFASRNVRWDGVGSLLRGYNIVSADAAAKWVTLSTVREATADEIKNLG